MKHSFGILLDQIRIDQKSYQKSLNSQMFLSFYRSLMIVGEQVWGQEVTARWQGDFSLH